MIADEEWALWRAAAERPAPASVIEAYAAEGAAALRSSAHLSSLRSLEVDPY
jgi:hypothetical protein